MKTAFLTTVAVLGLATGGFALAGVTVGGVSNGSVTVGQQLVVAVSDSLDASTAGYAHYLCSDPEAVASAHGQFTIGPLGPGEGGTAWTPLSVSCMNTATWIYSGSVTLTVPADAGGSEWISVAVQEFLPYNSYNFNQTYSVVTPTSTATSTTSMTTTGTTTVGTTTVGTTTVGTTTVGTTTVGTTTVGTATVGTTVTVPAGTTTISVPVTTTTVVTAVTAPPTATVARVVVLTMPSTITIRQTSGFIYLTITSNDTRSPQSLCWHGADTTTQRCASGSGSWRITIRRTSGKQMFVLKEHGKVVARKTVTVRLKR
jgi:hypothetical protein